MTNRRDLLASLAFAAFAAPATAQVRDINDAINKAGRQRMLSQRMAKAYLAIGQGVGAAQADKVLGDSMALFDRQLVELAAFAPDSQVAVTYGELQKAWGSYKTALVGAAPSKAGGAAVVKLAGDVLALAHQGTMQFERVSGRAVGRLVNVSGRQRMLSQRMAAMYFTVTWGVGAAEASRAMQVSQREFVVAHDALLKAPEATPGIRSQLELVQQQFVFFEGALRGAASGSVNPRALSDVFSSSERILQLMETVTEQFARLT